MTTPREQAPQAAYDMAIWQLTEQQRSVEGLDTKAGAVLTAALAFAGLFGAAVGLAIDSQVPESAIAALISGALVLAAFAFTFFAFKKAIETTSWVHGPYGQDLIDVGSRYGEDRVRLWLVERVVDSYTTNDALLIAKARWFHRALIGVIVEGALVTGGLIAVAVTSALAAS